MYVLFGTKNDSLETLLGLEPSVVADTIWLLSPLPENISHKISHKMYEH